MRHEFMGMTFIYLMRDLEISDYKAFISSYEGYPVKEHIF
jgi:hypothetical protein